MEERTIMPKGDQYHIKLEGKRKPSFGLAAGPSPEADAERSRPKRRASTGRPNLEGGDQYPGSECFIGPYQRGGADGATAQSGGGSGEACVVAVFTAMAMTRSRRRSQAATSSAIHIPQRAAISTFENPKST